MYTKNVEKRKIKINELLSIIKKIKLSVDKQESYGNYYNKYNHLEEELNAWVTEETVVFIVEEEYVNRLFFFTYSLEELTNILKEVPDKCVIDYVCNEMPDALESCFKESDFKQHAIYARRTLSVPFETKKGDPKYKAVMAKLYKPEVGTPAEISDLPSIKKIMFEVFDPINSDIPTSEELLEDIKNQTVWIYKVNEEIVTMYIFRVYGRKRYGAMTYNRLSADYLSSLVTNAHKESEKHHPVKWHYGWIDITNKKIIRTLEKEGVLELDGIKNYIYQKIGGN